MPQAYLARKETGETRLSGSDTICRKGGGTDVMTMLVCYRPLLRDRELPVAKPICLCAVCYVPLVDR